MSDDTRARAAAESECGQCSCCITWREVANQQAEEIARLRAALMDVADALGCNKHPEGHVERAKEAAREALGPVS